MSTQLAKKQGDLKALLTGDKFQEQLKLSLPAHLKPDRFCRIAITTLTKTPKLAECTPESFFGCLLQLSALGLEPDGRHAHLIPYGKACTLILDYKGIVSLVLRSGQVNSINLMEVCENDTFEENMGDVVTHKIERRNPRGEAYAYYSRVTLKDGSETFCIMSKDEVEEIGKASRGWTQDPWQKHFGEMAKKTVFRRHSKLLPLSAEVQTAIMADDDMPPIQRNITPQPKTLEAPRTRAEEIYDEVSAKGIDPAAFIDGMVSANILSEPVAWSEVPVEAWDKIKDSDDIGIIIDGMGVEA